MSKKHIDLEDLEIYKEALCIGDFCWELYEPLDWKIKKIMGDQFITAVDSIAANIAEGYGRFHYLDRIKFYYNARASLLEVLLWAELLNRRGFLKNENYEKLVGDLKELKKSLNAYISSLYRAKRSYGASK